jgi:hypothetical protein
MLRALFFVRKMMEIDHKKKLVTSSILIFKISIFLDKVYDNLKDCLKVLK